MSFGLFDTAQTACISEDGLYRYWLRRSWWGGSGQEICFVMLNPSTADATTNDPTIRRCIRFAKDWGYSHLTVRNLFPFRATDPKILREHPLEVLIGPQGNQELLACQNVGKIVVAWGANVPHHRDRWFLQQMKSLALYCLGKTNGGKPRHPLFVSAEKTLSLYQGNKT